jgi:hypothetical protein
MSNGRPPSSPLRIQVSRRACRYEISRRPHSRSRLTHPTSPALAHHHPLDQLSHRPRVYFGPLAQHGPERALTTASFLGCTANEGKSALNATLNWFSHLPISSSLPSTSLAVCCRPRSFLLTSHSSHTVRFISWTNGSKAHRRGVQSNSGGE